MARCTCCMLVSPLFFAYGRHEYEDLCVRNICDTLTLPDILACGEMDSIS